jgi:CubicO group peptidase (beta-lactamase class C family)
MRSLASKGISPLKARYRQPMMRRLFGLCWILAVAVLVGGCTQASTRTPSPSPSRTVDYAAMETAIEDKISSGSLGLSTINAVLVSVGGETMLAHYRNRSKPQDALHVWSVTKSVVSALIGIAIDEQIISGLDATLLELLPRYQKYLSAEEESITLRQLMSMTAGFPPDDPAPFENIHSVFKRRTDPIPMILTDGLDLPPGHGFSYSSRGAHLVSAVLREALVRADPDHPRSVLEYAREKLFDPLEIDSSGAREERVLLSDPAYDRLTRFDWATDAAGLNTACCLLRLRPSDMIKFGELYLGDGVWHGKQILPPGWVELSTTVSPHSEYALMWWRMTLIPVTDNPTAHDALIARGSEGQLIAIVPDLELVVAVGSVPTADYAVPGSDVSFLLTEVILPAFLAS